jgi:hypothetical protein
MGGAFERLDGMASRTVDAINAIAVVITPMKAAPNGRPAPDPRRDKLTATAVFDYVDAEFGVELGVRKAYGSANDLRSLQSGREPLVSIDRRYFATSSDEPRPGDRVDFPSRPDLPPFEVVLVKRDGLARLVLKLVHLGSQA